MSKYVAAMFADRDKTLIKWQKDNGEVGHTTFDPNLAECKEILKTFPIIKLEENFINFEREEDKVRNILEVYKNNQKSVDMILENWNLFDHSDQKFFRLNQVVDDWKLLEDNWDVLKELFSTPEEIQTRIIFKKNKEKILHLIDNWDFVNNSLVESDSYKEPEIIEKVVYKEVAKDITVESLKNISEDKEKFFKMKLEIFEMPEVKKSKDRNWKAKMRKASSTFALLGALNEGLENLKNESNESQD